MRRLTTAVSFVLATSLAAAIVGYAPRRASAQDAYACIDRLDDAEVSQRLAYLIRAFDDGAQHARLWWYGTLTFALGAAGLTWTLYGLSRDEGRDEQDPALVSAIGASLLVAQAVALPLPSAFAPQRLRRLPEGSPEERRAKLRRATRELERSAAREDLLRGITAHGGPFAYAIGTGTYLAVKRDNPFAIAQAFLAPPVIGELKIVTLPWNATRAWDRYRSFACQVPTYRPPAEESLDAISSAGDGDRDARRAEWSLVPAGAGLGLRVAF